MDGAAEVHGRGGEGERGDAGGEPGGCAAGDGDGAHGTGGHLNEDEEEDERGVGVFGLDAFAVHAVNSVEEFGGLLRHGDTRSGEAVGDRGEAGGVAVFRAETPGGDIDNFDGDGTGGAGVNAGGLGTGGESGMAHVALADDAAGGVELGDAVGAVPGAVLAADALIGVVVDDAGECVFGVGFDGAAEHAGGLDAVVAAHG